MPVHDDLGTRMKEFYEGIPKTKLMRRTPVAIRIDGKAFHTFTRGFKKPFDEVLVKSMQETTKYLCEHIQGCVLGYTQSDEITLILVDYKRLDSSAWFDYEVQKLCSISASMATMAFNKIFSEEVNAWFGEQLVPISEEVAQLYNLYCDRVEKGAMFDARCFNIPREEVTNLIYWRQLDATRNSIQMVGQANFSHRELQGKSCNMIQDMLHEEKGINWNDFPTYLKRGSCVVKHQSLIDGNWRWIVDKNIPIFKSEGREYIEKLIQPEES
ncbi:MAG: tRNA(His) guanylyltransferase Thg1 family protein [Bacteroidales bacterium]|nr:tRNA(His) guanylyltransferase Thg1 family protein [Bacteroidales bacterium]